MLFEKKIQQVLAPQSERYVQRALRLCLLVVAVGEKQEEQGVVLPFERDLEGSTISAAAIPRGVSGEL